MSACERHQRWNGLTTHTLPTKVLSQTYWRITSDTRKMHQIMKPYALDLAETFAHWKEVQTKKNYNRLINFTPKMLHFYFKNYSVIKCKASSRQYYWPLKFCLYRRSRLLNQLQICCLRKKIVFIHLFLVCTSQKVVLIRIFSSEIPIFAESVETFHTPEKAQGIQVLFCRLLKEQLRLFKL